MDQEPDQLDRIAIIGMAGRFPGAPDIDQFGKNLCAGIESVTTFTDEQLLSAGVEPSLLQAPNYVKTGVLLDGVELFDAEFFGYTPREAELADPQHRLFLECAWEALEDAGYDPYKSRLRIGVFAGAGTNYYFQNNLVSNPHLMASLSDFQRLLATDSDYLCTRVSYKLNLKGPSLTIQTACSTSLVATHLACQSLHNGECDMALAGGVSIKIPQIAGYLHEEGSPLSSDGRCRAFDASAHGMMFGSGAGVVVLKRLADALEDGDCVRAVIRGSAINNDGAAKIGYTAPSAEGQASVIAEAQALAGVSADEITYVEAHGTGTALGDPIEVAGLTEAFRRTTQRRGFCAIGSVKTNIGHLNTAAGVAGLIKVVLALQNRVFLPSLNFERPNPDIDFANSPFYVQQTLDGWQPANGRRVAGVSSFGIGGTNAHVIVEEAPPATDSDPSRPWQLLPLSAKTPEALEKATDRLAEFLASHPGLNLADAAFTLQEGRRAFVHRRILAAQSVDEAATLLRTREQKRVFTGFQEHTSCPVAFLFPGQASQYSNMGLEIYRTEKTFRESVDVCCEFLEPYLGFNLQQVLYPPADKAAVAIAQLNQTAVTQPAIFVVEYALSKLWMEWGVSPDAMIGHSIGEYVAACLGDVFSLEDALTLVAARGRLMQSMPTGSMLAVRLDEKSIRQYLSEELSLAVINGSSACVAAGPTNAIKGLQMVLAEKEIGCRLLQTSHAFHSQMMEPILRPFRKLFDGIKLSSPRIPYLSNVTGTWINSEQATDPGYWLSQLRQTVRFADGIGELLKMPQRILLEVGPGQTLASLTRQHKGKASEQVVLSSFGYAKDSVSELAEMMTTLGQLWIAGARMDWRALCTGQRRLRVALPSYSFERRRHWIEGTKLRDGLNVHANISDGRSGTQQSNAQSLPDEYPELRDAHVDQDTDLQEILATVWREVLGFERVGIHDNFFDLGGDSLVAIQVLSRIQKLLNIRLPLATLLQAPTIAGLAELLRKEHWTPSWSSLVPLRPGGSRPPLVLMHAHGGNVLEYYPLVSRLESDQPVYAFQARGLDGRIVKNSSLEAMASAYVGELRRLQPAGPYFLGGFCFGGYLALEAAQQLTAAKQEVALVILIQSMHPDAFHFKPTTNLLQRIWYRTTKRINLELENLSNRGKGYLVERSRRAWDVARARTAIAFDNIFGRKAANPSRLPMWYILEALAIEHGQALQKYVFRPYDGEVVLFRARKQLFGLSSDEYLGWQRVLHGKLDVCEVPGHQQTILSEPNVSHLAKELTSRLKAAQERGTGSGIGPMPAACIPLGTGI